MREVRKFVSIMSAIFSYLEENPEILEKIVDRVEQKRNFQREGSKRNEKEWEGIDLYKLYQEKGEEELRKYLEGLEIESLKSIIKYYRLDPKGNYRKWKTKERFITRIVDAIKIKSEKGKVFLEQNQEVR
jgi:hypothetical protein